MSDKAVHTHMHIHTALIIVDNSWWLVLGWVTTKIRKTIKYQRLRFNVKH